MCEIAIFDPEEYSLEELTSFSMEIYQSMQTSFGVVAASKNDGVFDYEVFKSVDPEWSEIRDFYEENDDPYRYFVHGRMATAGERDIRGAHPIEIDCPECDIHSVMHNGVVVQHKMYRSEHEDEGHVYQTDVDTETIAHTFPEVPDDFDTIREWNNFQRESAFVVFDDERILVYTNGSYMLTEDARMSRKYRRFGPDKREETYKYLLISAGGGDE